MVFTELAYKTDACGKIGPWMLTFALGGIYGQEKPIEPATLGPVGDINGAGALPVLVVPLIPMETGPSTGTRADTLTTTSTCG